MDYPNDILDLIRRMDVKHGKRCPGDDFEVAKRAEARGLLKTKGETPDGKGGRMTMAALTEVGKALKESLNSQE